MKSYFVALLGGGIMAVLVLSLPEAAVLAQHSREAPRTSNSQASAGGSSATLDRMIAAGKSRRELAQYVFATQGCKNCHTIGKTGKLGLTKKGERTAQGYEGCVAMLTAMSAIAQVPEDERPAKQRQTAGRFEQFGCVTCHKITPGTMGLTEVAAKLKHLHLGCVDVEKLISRRAGL